MDALGIDAAVDAVNIKTVPLLEAAVGRQLAQATKDTAEIVDRAVLEVSNTLNGALQGIQAITDKAARDLGAIVSRMDGASVTLHLPEAKS